MSPTDTAPAVAAPPSLAREILVFWFGEDPAQPIANASRWFTQDDAFDAEVRARFGGALAGVEQGAYDDWYDWPDTLLALVLLLDQFPRNMHRGSAQAFAYDTLARHATMAALVRGHESLLSPVQQWFLYMPLMHSEDLADQERGLRLFQRLAATPGLSSEVADALANVVSYAERHRACIEHCGRFPHRNAALGRTPTAEDTAWLAEHPDGF